METKELKDKALSLLVDSIDLQKLAKGLITDVIEDALQELVDDTTNPYDNMVKASLYPLLEEKILEAIDKKLDLRKILGLEVEQA